MSSLSRRACYKCGNVGHYAEVCSSAERLCYNSGPGPLPGVGRGLGAPRGGFVGGFAPRGGFAGGPRPATCYKCGGPNHFARDCQAQAMKCYACGKLGHISRDCTAPNGGPLNTAGKTCYQCGEAGHISRDCPQKTTNGDLVDVDHGLAAIAAPIAPIA
ncbi:zinc knuckle domain protein [Diplocarpon rosae]|nr:zinc knuckle domain protein [Diplocarpon rosae]